MKIKKIGPHLDPPMACVILFWISPSVGEVGVVVHDVLFDRMVRLREVRPQKRVPPRLHERVPCKINGKIHAHYIITFAYTFIIEQS